MINLRTIRYTIIDLIDALRIHRAHIQARPLRRSTVPLRLSRAARLRVWFATRDPLRLVLPLVLALLCLLSALALIKQLRMPGPMVESAQPTPALITIIATAPAVALPAAPSIIPPRLVTAYDQPNGNALGPIPEPAIGAIVARWGDGWLQTTWDGGPVWVRAEDLGANLADMRPVPQITIAPVAVSQPVYVPAPPAYQVDSAPAVEAAPPPPPPPPAADERQAAIQAHYANDYAPPAPAQAATPSLEDAIRNLDAHQQESSPGWRDEHCFGDVCTP